jgi:hypothetical protein
MLDDKKELDEKPVWGAKAIGEVINRTPRQAFYMLEGGTLKSAKKTGGRWSGLPSKLRAECFAEVDREDA